MPQAVEAEPTALDELALKNYLRLIGETLGAPPDRPLLPVVVRTLVDACESEELASMGEKANTQINLIRKVAETVKEGHLDVLILMAGRKTEYPVWAAFVHIPVRRSKPALRLIGSEFLLSLAEGRPFRKSVAVLAVRLADKPEIVKTNTVRYITKITDAARKAFTAADKGASASDLLLSRRIGAALAVQKQMRDPDSRKCVGSDRSLEKERVKEVANNLHGAVCNGDLVGVSVSVAFVLGLPWDTALDVPFLSRTDESYIAAIDVVEGRVVVRLEDILAGLAKVRDGCVPQSKAVRRPLPLQHAEILRTVCATTPEAKNLRELLSEIPSNTACVPGSEDQPTLVSSIAKFIASRGTAALAAGVDRPIAAYAFGAFGLIGNARYHYLSVSQAETNDACDRTYKWLGWGASVQMKESSTSIGSGVTPTKESILQIDEVRRTALENSRVGKRTKIDSLLEFHNFYALLCTHRAAFFTLARASREYAFTSKALAPDIPFTTLCDKAAGPWGGKTPLPMPNSLAIQIKLWHAHLCALDGRLKTFKWDKMSESRAHIAAVLRFEERPLFFLIRADGTVHIPGSSDLFPLDAKVKHDAYRNFVSNALRRAGVPGEFVDAASRHTVPFATVHSITSTVSAYQWLSHCAAGLDKVALELGIEPVAGLARK